MLRSRGLRSLMIMSALGLAACAKAPQTVFRPESVGTHLIGDFNGDGKPETATLVQIAKTKPGAEDGWKGEWQVRFSDTSIKAPPGGYGGRLINEGDLNGDGTDELSLAGEPNHGCNLFLTTYGYHAGAWIEVVPVFMAPTFCDEVSDEELQKKVFLEDGRVYFTELDMDAFNNEKVVWKKSAVKATH